MTLSIEENIAVSFTFAKEGLVGHWERWFVLMVLIWIPLGFITVLGYLMQIFKGGDTAPELERYAELCTDGIKAFVIWVVFIAVLNILYFLIDLFMGGSSLMRPIGIGLSILFHMATVVAWMRCAKTGSFREGLRFRAIGENIEDIGLVHYFLSCIFFLLACGIISGFFALGTAVIISPWIGILIFVLMLPFFILWGGKFFENLYTCA